MSNTSMQKFTSSIGLTDIVICLRKMKESIGGQHYYTLLELSCFTIGILSLVFLTLHSDMILQYSSPGTGDVLRCIKTLDFERNGHYTSQVESGIPGFACFIK